MLVAMRSRDDNEIVRLAAYTIDDDRLDDFKATYDSEFGIWEHSPLPSYYFQHVWEYDGPWKTNETFRFGTDV